MSSRRTGRLSRASTAANRIPLWLASSHGGHMELLLAVEPAYRDLAHAFLTAPGRQADDLAKAGNVVRLVVNPERSPWLIAINAVQALRLAVRERPRVVVSPGANVALAFCLFSRLLGARIIFIETTARVHGGSLTGRILSRVADRVLVQWPELLEVYPRAELCRPVLFEQVGAAASGRGTLVAAGTHSQPFDRLLRIADDAAADGLLREPVTVQAGTSRHPGPPGMRRSTFEPAEMERAVAEAELVLCHGGSGLISLALRSGRTPIVLPRRSEFGEHVDDHQVGMVEKLASLGLVAPLDELAPEQAIATAREHPAQHANPSPGAGLAERLGELIRERL